jgi:hypothetical protein
MIIKSAGSAPAPVTAIDQAAGSSHREDQRPPGPGLEVRTVPHPCQNGAGEGCADGHWGETQMRLGLDRSWCQMWPIHLCTQGVRPGSGVVGWPDSGRTMLRNNDRRCEPATPIWAGRPGCCRSLEQVALSTDQKVAEPEFRDRMSAAADGSRRRTPHQPCLPRCQALCATR